MRGYLNALIPFLTQNLKKALTNLREIFRNLKKALKNLSEKPNKS